MSDVRELVELVARFGRTYMRWLRSRMDQAGGCHPTQAQLLGILHYSGPQKLTTLSHHLGVTPRNVTKLVDALEAEGLVCRRATPGDRRATLAELTPAGRGQMQQLFRTKMEAVAPLFEERLSPADRAELARLIRQLLAGLEE